MRENDFASDPARARRVGVLRIVLIVAATAAALSLIASTLVQSLPPLVLFLACLFGMIESAAVISFGDRIRSWETHFAMTFMPGLVLLYYFDGGYNYPVLHWWWAVLSAAFFGMLLLPIRGLETHLTRLSARARADAERMFAFQESGDSKLKARWRIQAEKMGIVYLTLLLLMAAGLAAFGLYGVAYGDVWGIALTFMWLPPIAFLLWLFRLRQSAKAIQSTG